MIIQLNKNGIGRCVFPCKSKGKCSKKDGNCCPKRKICTDEYCCPNNGYNNQSCDDTADCNDSFCVNGICRCVKGKYKEICTTNDDCESNKCLHTQFGSYCTLNDCVFNNLLIKGDKTGICESEKPYCIQGKCSRSILNSDCVSSDENLYYCVDGKYSNDPGEYGQQCLETSDCQTGLHCDFKNYTCLPFKNNICFL